VTDTGRMIVRTVVPPLVRKAVAYEWGMWRSLYRWTLRRPLRLEPGARAFGYVTVVTPIIVVFIALSAIEVPILHLILPWETVRLVGDMLGAYGLFWMIGMLASLRVHPHVVGDAGLRIRYGFTVDFTIPWEAIATVRARYRSLPSSRKVQLDRTDAGRVLHLGVASQTSVDVVLRQPTVIPLSKLEGEPITELRFFADGPDGLVAYARERLKAELPNSDR
jgi:hypothetical protein